MTPEPIPPQLFPPREFGHRPDMVEWIARMLNMSIADVAKAFGQMASAFDEAERGFREAGAVLDEAQRIKMPKPSTIPPMWANDFRNRGHGSRVAGTRTNRRGHNRIRGGAQTYL